MTEPLRVRLGAEGFTKHVGGVRRVSLELAKALSSIGVEVTADHQLLERVAMSTAQPSGIDRVRLQAAEFIFPLRSYARAKTGIHHALYYDFLLPTRRWPIVVTMYDMIHELYGHGTSRLTLAKRQSVRNATVVVAISEKTAADAQRLLGIRVPIQVVPLGLSEAFLASDEIEPPALGIWDELLFVGSRDGYKNFDLLLRALESDPRLCDLRLTVVGGGVPSTEELTHWSKVLGEHRLRHVGRISDEGLCKLYQSSAALVLPSRYEGFGLPLLEAMAVGCPVACSMGGALPEVAAGHARMFDADSVYQCAEAILGAIAITQQEQKAARTYARDFTWERTARAYRALYEAL